MNVNFKGILKLCKTKSTRPYTPISLLSASNMTRNEVWTSDVGLLLGLLNDNNFYLKSSNLDYFKYFSVFLKIL